MKRAPTEQRITLKGKSNTNSKNTPNTHSNDTQPKADILPPAIGMTHLGPYGCTAQEARFAELVAEGSTATDAYEMAFNPKDRKAAHNGGYKVARRERVQQYVAELQNRMPSELLHDGDHARQFILNKLYDLADNANRSSDQLKAVELLGKVDFVGIFRERTIVEEPKRDMEQLKSEIKQRLKALLTDESK